MTVILGTIALLAALLAMLLTAVAGLLALSILISFSVAWYERVTAEPSLDAQHRYGQAAKLLIGEYACLLATVLLRPLGWLPVRMAKGMPRRTPVIMLHGLFQNRSCLLPLAWRLRAAGYDYIVSINTPAWRDHDKLVDVLAGTVAAVRHATGTQQVALVGHSMGGILARSYLQRPGSADAVSACVTLGSPHQGSRLAPFAVSRHGRDLRPGSPLLAALNSTPTPASVHFTSIYSRHDNIIVPAGHASLAGAHNVELSGLGHTALLFSARVAERVAAALDDSSKAAS